MSRPWTEKRVVFEGTIADNTSYGSSMGIAQGETDHMGKTISHTVGFLLQQERFERGDRVRITVEKLRDPEPEGDSE